MQISEESTVLSSWKDIASYLGKGVRTVQRWERQLGLPVRRPVGASQKSAVLLYRGDVDAWLATRFSSGPRKTSVNALTFEASARAALGERIERARALRVTHQALTEQIQASIRRLNEQCDLLRSRSRRATLDAQLDTQLKAQSDEVPLFSVTPNLLPNVVADAGRLSSERSRKALAH